MRKCKGGGCSHKPDNRCCVDCEDRKNNACKVVCIIFLYSKPFECEELEETDS